MAHIPRIYLEQSLNVDETITLPVAASHHLMRVLRRTVGDALFLFNGQGGEFHAQIVAMSKQQVTVCLSSYLAHNRSSPLLLHLGQAWVRGEKMDLILQKATELGVTQITPLLTDYVSIKGEVDRWHKRQAHWQAVLINACEQCGRNQLPELHPPCELPVWLAQQSERGQGLLFSPQADISLSQVTMLPQTPVGLLIGPEGGLSPNEEALALSQHFQAVRLGPRILRTETAAIAAITAAQMQWGDL